MKKKYRYLVYELILLIAGVFVFRSLWTLMDSIEFFNYTIVHIVLLIVGIVATITAVNGLAPKSWWEK